MLARERFAKTWVSAGIALAFAICAVLLAWSWFLGGGSSGLAERGVDTTGTVIAITKSAGLVSKYGTANPATFYVTYRFMDGIGTPHEAMTNGTSRSYSGLAIGQKIAVRYLPDDPAVSIYVAETRGPPSDKPMMLLFLLLVCAAFFGFMAFNGFRKPKVPA
jgi:hypothetical protein